MRNQKMQPGNQLMMRVMGQMITKGIGFAYPKDVVINCLNINDARRMPNLQHLEVVFHIHELNAVGPKHPCIDELDKTDFLKMRRVQELI